jgi:hypothetical protein
VRQVHQISGVSRRQRILHLLPFLRNLSSYETCDEMMGFGIREAVASVRTLSRWRVVAMAVHSWQWPIALENTAWDGSSNQNHCRMLSYVDRLGCCCIVHCACRSLRSPISPSVARIFTDSVSAFAAVDHNSRIVSKFRKQ